MMISLNDPLGGSEGPASSATPAPELGTTLRVLGMARKRLETMSNAVPGVASPASASSPEEMVMAFVGDAGHVGTASAIAVSGSTDALGAGWTTLAPS
jgi:hypothetical protein